MDSVTSLPTSPDFLTSVRKAGVARWKLETLTGLMGIRSLENHQRETEKNLAAENEHVRTSVWGAPKSDPAGKGDEVQGTTILGDNVHPTPIVIAGQQPAAGAGGMAKLLAGLAIGTLIPGAGLAGFAASQLLSQGLGPAPVISQPPDSETIGLGLGKIEDYLQPDAGRKGQ